MSKSFEMKDLLMKQDENWAFIFLQKNNLSGEEKIQLKYNKLNIKKKFIILKEKLIDDIVNIIQDFCDVKEFYEEDEIIIKTYPDWKILSTHCYNYNI